jgi:two-component system sensor histidine kinase/response regulator
MIESVTMWSAAIINRLALTSQPEVIAFSILVAGTVAGTVLCAGVLLRFWIARTSSTSKATTDQSAAETADAPAYETADDAKRGTGELVILRTALNDHALFSIADRSGKIIDANEGFCRISGYSREELIGSDHRILNSGHHPKSFWIEMWKTIAAGRTWRNEVCNRAKDGSLYWVDSTNIPQFDAQGNIDRYISLRFDITAQKQMGRELAELQDRLERAIEGTSAGLWDYMPATGECWYDDQFKRLVGVEPDDPLFRPVFESFSERLHPEDRSKTLEAIRLHIDEHAEYDMEFRLWLPTGEYRWFRSRATSTRDEHGVVKRVSGAISDVHERHTTETRLRLATRAARIGLWDWDVSTGESHFSETYYTMLGYEPGDFAMTFDAWTSLIHPDDAESVYENIRQHFEGELSVYSAEIRIRCKDGSWRWIRTVGEIVERHADGTPKRMTGIHIDIEDLQHAIREANEANRAKSEFLANMSHEIRTPMTAILGYADLLGSEYAHDPIATADAVRTIQSSANHLLTIINDILDVSKIEAGQLKLELLKVDVVVILEEIMSLIRPRAAGKGIQARLTYETPIPERFTTDPTRLRQILMNLVGNSLKFTEVGSITLCVGFDEARSMMWFRITDTGIGMSEEQCERIARFEAFSQADASTTRRFGGTGLGLRISNALAQLLGGEIRAHSTLNKGSTFTLTIHTGDVANVRTVDPNMQPKPMLGSPLPMTADPYTQPTHPALDGLHILLAEDGPDNQRLLTHLLKRAGAITTLCENGLVAVETVQRASEDQRPHLILMDMQMPELDGYDATRRLRRLGHRIPIIALTAHAMDGDRQKCLDAGCDDYLTKPVNKETLFRICRAWTAGVRSMRTDAA